jgi:hypothetical protein
MKALVPGFATLALAFAASAQTAASFKRPDCSAYAASLKPERKCVREVRRIWQEANYAALQKTGLMFVYMARPDPKASPDAMKVIERKVEGSFAIRFSVKTDGTVYDVQTMEVTEGVQPLAKAWADAIGQWTFARTSEPVSGIEYRRIYMYSDEEDEDDDPSRSQHAAH